MATARQGRSASAAPTPETIGVLICSYRRPDRLTHCLDALATQLRRPDDVIVVCRHEDTATRSLLTRPRTDGLPVRMLIVHRPGTVHALNTGLDAVSTDVIAIADDDTVAQPQWLQCIHCHFVADAELGGVGGRDRCYLNGFDDRQEKIVGRLQWIGRAIGNHHLGFGEPRPVQHLKGANMAYRTAAIGGIRFDTRLRGSGAQPFEDFSFSMRVRRAGWKLLYDPAALVHHFAGQRDEPRHYAGIARVNDAGGLRDCAFNYVVAVWEEFSLPRRVGFILWSILVGTGINPGLVQAVRFTPRLGWSSWYRMVLTLQGKFAACRLMSRRAGAAYTAATAGSTGGMAREAPRLPGSLN